MPVISIADVCADAYELKPSPLLKRFVQLAFAEVGFMNCHRSCRCCSSTNAAARCSLILISRRFDYSPCYRPYYGPGVRPAARPTVSCCGCRPHAAVDHAKTVCQKLAVCPAAPWTPILDAIRVPVRLLSTSLATRTQAGRPGPTSSQQALGQLIAGSGPDILVLRLGSSAMARASIP